MLGPTSWLAYFMLGNLAFLVMVMTPEFPRFRSVAKWIGVAFYVLTSLFLFAYEDPGAPWFLLLTLTIGLLSATRVKQGIVEFLKPVTDPLGQWIANVIGTVAGVATLLVALGIVLLCIYGLVRFVKWAWYQ